MNVTSKFRVKEIVDEQGDVWLEDRSPGRAGMLVAVEKDVDYPDTLERKIGELAEGEVIEATLKSQNKRHTIWHFTAIEEPSGRESAKISTPS